MAAAAHHLLEPRGPSHDFTRSARGLKETRQGGLFGVFRDASPEGFGLAFLERLRNTSITDLMQRLELSEGNTVGAAEVCDDIGAKCAFQPPTSQELADALASLPPEQASSAAAREVKGVRRTAQPSINSTSAKAALDS